MRYWIGIVLFLNLSCSNQGQNDFQPIEDKDRNFIMYPDFLSGLRSTEYYNVQAYLYDDSHSFIVLNSHFSGFPKQDGVQVKIEKRNQDLILEISTPGIVKKTEYKKSEYFSQTNLLDITLAVTNKTSYGAQVRVWDHLFNPKGFLKKRVSFLKQDNLLFDTLEDQILFYSYGQGLRWGLKFYRAKVVEGKRVSPQESVLQ